MNVTSRVKGCSQLLYNNLRKETKCCKWKVIPAVWKKGHSPQLIVTLPVEKCSLVEPEMLLAFLQDLIIEPCHKPVQTSQNLGFYFFKIIFNANKIRITASPVWSFPSSYYVPHSPPHLSSAIWLPSYYPVKSSNCEAPHYANFSFFCFLPSLRSNTLLGIFF